MEYQVITPIPPGLDAFTRAYLECAEWCGLDEEGHEALELAVRPHWDGNTLRETIAECSAFQADHWADIESDPARAGFHFYLTRNRHGAGFWDGDYPDAVGKRLTDAAHAYGETYVDFDPESEELTIS